MSIAPQLSQSRLRIAIFGSYYRGFHVLHECLFGPLAKRIEIVGVATDAPEQTFISRQKRVWQYPHTSEEASMVRNLASRESIQVFDGRVKDQAFHELLKHTWRPDLCIMATFGQLIDMPLFSYPPQGFYNLHPYDGKKWPSKYAGANPFAAMIRDCLPTCVIGMHHVDSTFDTGALVRTSEIVAIPPSVSVTDMHKITSLIAALMVRYEIERILNSCSSSEHLS